MGHNPTYNALHHRLRYDDDGLNSQVSGWISAEDTENSSIDMGRVFRVRWRITETAANGTNNTFKMQCNVASGGWNDIETWLTGTTTGVLSVLSAQFADGDSITTQYLTSGGGTFINGAGDEESNSASSNIDNEETEVEFALWITRGYDGNNFVSDGTSIELRIVEGDGTVFGGTNNTVTILANDAGNGYIGGTFVEHPMRTGPYKDANDNLYFIMEHSETDNTCIIMKSTDNGATWAEVDGANRPTDADFEGGDSQQVGDTIHILGHMNSSIRYYTFRTSDHATNPDTWNIKEAVTTGLTQPTTQSCAIAVLSDGDVYAFYAHADDTVDYKRRNGTWGSATELDTEASTVFISVDAIVGENDLTHILYKDDTNGTIYARSLTSTGTLNSRQTIATHASVSVGGDNIPFINQVYYDDDGVEVIMIMYKKALGGAPLFHRTLRDDGAPGTETQVTDQNVEEGEGSNNMVIGHAAVDGKTVHVLYSERTNMDMWHAENTDEGGWGTDVEEHDGVRLGWLGANVYSRGGGTYLGYCWDDNSQGHTGGIWFDEIELAAAPAGKTRPAIVQTPATFVPVHQLQI